MFKLKVLPIHTLRAAGIFGVKQYAAGMGRSSPGGGVRYMEVNEALIMTVTAVK